MELDSNDDEFNELLNDYSTLTMKFQEFEENILKLMENKQTIEKETEKLSTDNTQELKKLKETEDSMKLELNKLNSEKSKDEKILRELKKNTHDNFMNGDIVKMIPELYMATIYYDEPESSASKKLKNKKEQEYINEIMDSLRVINFLIYL